MNADLVAKLKEASPIKVRGDAEIRINGRTILFDYGCPVAIWIPGRGIVSPLEVISPTTSRRITKWEPTIMHSKVTVNQFIGLLQGS